MKQLCLKIFLFGNKKTANHLLYLVFFLSIGSLYSQQNMMGAFKPLLNKTWKAEGNWENGSHFKQQTFFYSALENNIVLAKTNGFIDSKQTKFGERNLGIRKYDKTTNSIQFWEFDAFGGLTTGTITVKGNNLYYHYNFAGKSLTDAWEFVNDHTYTFKVGYYENNKWKKVLLECQFNSVEKKP